MTWWGMPPNAERYRVSSWNLVISRHDATTSRTGEFGRDGVRAATPCATSTCQPRVDSVRVALALLFSLS